MGTAVGRIVKEYIFRELVDERIPLRIHGTRKELEGIATDVDAKTVTMELAEAPVPTLRAGESLRVFFHFQNNYHTFESEVVSHEHPELVIVHPPKIYRNVERKYERIRVPAGIRVSFSILGEDVELNFPRSEHAGDEKIDNLGTFHESTQNINVLIAGFRKRMSAKFSANEIVMMRDKPAASMFEKLMVRTRKTLWIPSTEEEFPFYDPFPDDRIILKFDLRKIADVGAASGDALSDAIMTRLISHGVYSALYCPILYREYLAGYVSLANNATRREKIPEQVVDYVWEFARVLCYALQANGYFRREGDEDELMESSIIDMSASGMLFTYSGDRAVDELDAGSEIDLVLEMDERKVVIGARVMRRFENDRSLFFGVQYVRISPNDFAFLFEYLYGKPFSAEFEELTEGAPRGESGPAD